MIFVKMVFIAGFYLNPMQVTGLLPKDNGTTCTIITTNNALVRNVDMTCAKVAEIIHSSQKAR